MSLIEACFNAEDWQRNGKNIAVWRSEELVKTMGAGLEGPMLKSTT